jgi:hypothetical protein
MIEDAVERSTLLHERRDDQCRNPHSGGCKQLVVFAVNLLG